MSATLEALLERNAELLVAVREARLSLAAAFGNSSHASVKPIEVPPAAWLAARAESERATGCRFRKYFSSIGAIA